MAEIRNKFYCQQRIWVIDPWSIQAVQGEIAGIETSEYRTGIFYFVKFQRLEDAKLSAAFYEEKDIFLTKEEAQRAGG